MLRKRVARVLLLCHCESTCLVSLWPSPGQAGGDIAIKNDQAPFITTGALEAAPHGVQGVVRASFGR